MKRSVSAKAAVATIGLVIVLSVTAAVVARHSGGSPTGIDGDAGVDIAATDAELASLYANQTSNVEVSGVGTVTRLLADDNDGSRHQRFIVALASGQTLLVAHNIDIAPRLDGLAVGDSVGFTGEYVYSDQGGTIHWTHHDPSGSHAAGWLAWRGRRYS